VTTTTARRPVLLGTWRPLSPEWHAARADGLGGSEIAAVLGLSKWESRFSLWHRKAARIGPQAESPEMEWGKRLEPAIIAKFADEHPGLVVFPTGTWRHAERPWQVANPDALLHARDDRGLIADQPDALLEAKFALYDDEWGEPGTDEIPPYYLAQCRWYLDVLGLDTCHVAVLIGGHDYREYVVHPDSDDTATMLAAATEFIASLRTGQRPDIDEHGATYQAICELHPLIDPVDVDLPADLARDFCRARHALKAAEAAAQQQTSLVADALGTGRRARFLDQTIATRQARGDRTPYLVAGRGLPTFTEQEHQS
jgi:putative phage-type endonuclease